MAAQGNLSKGRLTELNSVCIECIRKLSQNFQTFDPRKCMMCPVGMELHRLDKDNVDGHNSCKYEKYFDA